MRWDPSDIGHITVRADTADLNEPVMPQPGYTVTLTAFTDTTITSTLSRTAEDGITVSCIDPFPTLTTIGSTTINIVGVFSVCHCVNDVLPHRSTRTTFHHVSLYWEQFS